MAADLIMPTLADQHPHTFQPVQPTRPLHQRSQSYQAPPDSTSSSYPQISPLSTSGSTIINPSPTSPKSYHARQLRPLYVPAVLRPTEFPSKPPKCSKSETPPPIAAGLRRSSNSFLSLAGLAVQRLSRRSTGDSGKALDGELDPEVFPDVTAPPTKRHWKPDAASIVCDDPTCMRAFGYFTRRHHCRRCGNIFCDVHSNHIVPLDQDANYNPRGPPSRSCGHCFGQFQAWKTSSGQVSSSASSDGAANTTPASPIVATSPTVVNGVVGTAKSPDIAESVPRDWNWSTF